MLKTTRDFKLKISIKPHAARSAARRIPLLALCLLGLLTACAGSATAATKTWTSNAAGSGSWSLADNWNLDTAPVDGDTLVFGIPVAGGTRTTTNDFPADTKFNGITVNANAFTLSGNPIKLGGNFAFTAGSTSSTCTVSLNTELLQNTDISVTASGSGTQPLLTWNGIISGNFGVTKSGGGSTRWQTNAKTYNGDTTIKYGTLELNAANVLPFGAGKGNLLISSGAFINTVSGATHNINGLFDGPSPGLDAQNNPIVGGGTFWSNSSSGTKILILGNNDASGSFSGALSQTIGAIAVTKNGTGTQTLSGALSYTGATTVNGGTLNLNVPTSSIGASAVSLAGKSIVNFASTGTLTTTGQINTNTATTDNTVINHTQGTLAAGDTFMGNNSGSYSAYLLSGGALNVTNFRVGSAASGAAGSYGYFRQSAGTVTIPNTGLTTVNRGTNTTSVLHVTGGTYNAGGNQMNLGFSANGTGVLTVNGGTVIENQFILTGQNGSTGIVNLNGGTVRANGIILTTTPVIGTGFINFNGGTVQAGAVNANFLTATNANIYSGGAKIDTNNLDITIGQALQATGGTTGVATIPVATGGSGYIAPPVVHFTPGSGEGTGATAVANLTGGVVTSITITSAGTGYTSAPTVALAGGGPTTPATLGTVTTGLNADDGGLAKSGAGTLTLTGTSTYTGPTTINNGTLIVGDGTSGSIANSAVTVGDTTTLKGQGATGAVTVQSGGTHAPGLSPGIQATGDYNLQSGGDLQIEINGTNAGTDYDQVAVTGSVTLAGNLVLSLGFAPTSNSQTFKIIDNDGTADAVNGTFAQGSTITGTFNSQTYTFTINYAGGDGNDVVLTSASAPVVTTTNGTTAFIEGNNTTSTPVAVDGDLTVSDADTATLASASVAITGGFQTGEDVLAFTNDGATMGNISGSYDSGTGELTLSSAGATATLAQWQAALRSVTYTNTSETPSTTNRTISFTVNDGTFSSATTTKTVSVTATNDTPIVTTTNGTTAFIEGNNTTSTPVAIDGGLTLSDADSATLASASVAITGGFQTSQDVLAFTNDGTTMGNIAGSYDSGTGVLTLTSAGATATVAEWQAALRAVTYTNTSNTPNTANRTISFTVNDGTTDSAAATKTVSVTATADAPGITGATTNEDTQSSSGLVISRNAGDGTEVTHFQITGITGGTLFKNNGTTQINNNDFITFAEGNAGLKFTPTANLFSPTTAFGFTAAGATSAAGAGLGTGTAVTITVNPVADPPVITPATTNEDTQTTSGLVISRNAVDGAEVTHFKITNITNGTLFKNNGTTQINNNDFITFAEGNAGLKFTPSANFFGIGTFTAAGAVDNTGTGLGTGTPVNITVNPVADPPTITPATTNEDTQTTSGLVISRNAVDGAEVTHFRISGITGGTLYLNNGITQVTNGDSITFALGNAGLKFTPTANLFSPTTAFGFTAAGATSAGGAGLGIGTAVSITVNPIADVPSITTTTTAEDTQSTTGLVISRNAVDSTEVSHFRITSITNGTLFKNNGTTQINNGDYITFAEGNAGLKFTPTPNLNSQATTFGFIAAGATNGAGAGLGVGTAVNITVTEVNDAPTSLDDSPSNVAEDSAQRTISFASLLANDTKGPANESGQTLTITGVSNAVGGTAVIQGTNVLFTPTPNYNGPAGFEYTVSDNGTTNGVAAPLTDTGLVSFTITEVNDAPVALDDSPSNIAEDSGQRTISFASLLANDTKGAANESGQTLTITAVNNAVGGTAVIQGTDVIFTPTPNYNGPAGFEYTVSDNGTTNGVAAPLTDTGLASFTITEVNDAPVALDDSPANVTEDSAQRTISFASLLANDTKGAANESGQTLTITAVSNAVGGTATIQGTDVLFTPTADYNGPASFDYTLSDNGTTNGAAAPLTDTGAVTFTITEVNDAPVALDDFPADVTEDSGQRTISFASLLGNDNKGAANEGGQTLTITSVTNATGGTATIQGTNVLFTPTADYNGPAGFTYTVEDNGTTNGVAAPLTDTGLVSFTVTEVNDAPVALDDFPADVTEDSGQRTISFASLLGNDTKGDANEGGQTLTITAVTNAVGGTAVIQGTDVLFTLTADYNGPAGFDYTLSDNGTTNGVAAPLTDTGAVSFTVTEVNDAPVALDDSAANVTEDSGQRTISFASLLGNDSKGAANESGQTLTITAVNNVVGGTATIQGTDVIFTPTDNYNGPAGFDYTVQDNGTTNGVATPLTDTGLVSFTITEVNDAPVAGDDALSNIAEDSGQRTISFASLLGNDTKGAANESGQTLTITDVSNVVGGTAVIQGTDVIFTPAANFHGMVSFDYTVTDDGTTNGAAAPLTDTGTVTFTVNPVADTPSVTNATTMANVQTTSGLVITPNAADGAEVTHFKITGITGGTLYQNDGTTQIHNGDFITVAEGAAGLKFTPGTNLLSPTTDFSFQVQASLSNSDAGLGGAAATATITVTEPSQSGPNFVVNTTDDNNDGTCGLSHCSLREAIIASNQNPDANTITFNPTAFATAQTITLTNGQLPGIVQSVTITGPAVGVIVNGNDLSRLLRIDSGTVNLTRFTLLDGKTASGESGGAMAVMQGANVTLTNCTFSSNDSATSGGAIFNDGILTLNRCTLAGNSAPDGGAIYNGSSGTLNLNNSTIANNSASVNGAAIFNAGTANVDSATIADNDATNLGDGIDNGGTLNITNTILDNSGNNLHNLGTVNSGGYNIASDDQSALLNKPGDKNSTDPLLDPAGLKGNGGFTQTIALQFTSPAINAGNTALTIDQRGMVRPQGSGDDIGAFEVASLSVSGGTVTEGDGGTVNLPFTVTLTAPSSQTVTVDYATADGSSIPATAGSDYTPASGTLTFVPGETTKTVNVAVLGDTIDEFNERVALVLSNASNAVVGLSTEGVITDNDAIPGLSINDVQVTESNGGTVQAVFTLTLSEASEKPITVIANTNTLGGSPVATPGTDYNAVTNATVTFAPGQTTRPLNVSILGDVSDESDEKFGVRLTGAVNASIADNSAVGTILDNDNPPVISGTVTNVTEGNAGTTTMTFTLKLSAASGRNVSVKYETANSATFPATAGNDYGAIPSTTVIFLAGETTKTVDVTINGDLLDEANERVALQLSNAVNATVGTVTDGVIVDDDATPSLSINDVSTTEGNNGTKLMTFTVTLLAASGQTVTVNAATSGGGSPAATAGTDYAALTSTTITFAPGETSKQVSVVINGDTTVEQNEKLGVILSGAVNATIADNSGIGTILNDDAAPLNTPSGGEDTK